MPDVTTSSGVVRGVEEDGLVAWPGVPYAASTEDRVECDQRRARRQAWTGYANHR
jgi:hypothetical protein